MRSMLMRFSRITGRMGVLSLIVLIAAIMTGCSNKDVSDKSLHRGELLEIPLADISSEANFYPIEVDGTAMEIIAVQASDGTVRTAFNTCQVCYSSGRGYYKQEGDRLVCQNCGNQFTMDQVETSAGGCNPWPIFDENTTMSDTSISISYDYLQAAKEIFADWKIS